MKPRALRGTKRAAAVALAVFAAFFLLFAPGRALAKYEPPPHTSHVVDQANVLDDQREARLVAHLQALREQKGYSIVVFLPSSLGGNTVEDVAYDTFNAWGVGSKEKDDGVLLVVAPNDRKMWIETGKGVGDRITDVQAGRIYRDVMTPRLKAGDTAGAVEEGVASIERALTGQDPVVAPPKAPRRGEKRTVQSVQLTTTQKWVGGGILALVILLAIVSRGFRRVLFSILEVLMWAALLGRGGGGGGGGGSGGGGNGGGGGRSGGGGAGGGW